MQGVKGLHLPAWRGPTIIAVSLGTMIAPQLFCRVSAFMWLQVFVLAGGIILLVRDVQYYVVPSIVQVLRQSLRKLVQDELSLDDVLRFIFDPHDGVVAAVARAFLGGLTLYALPLTPAERGRVLRSTFQVPYHVHAYKHSSSVDATASENVSTPEQYQDHDVQDETFLHSPGSCFVLLPPTIRSWLLEEELDVEHVTEEHDSLPSDADDNSNDAEWTASPSSFVVSEEVLIDSVPNVTNSSSHKPSIVDSPKNGCIPTVSSSDSSSSSSRKNRVGSNLSSSREADRCHSILPPTIAPHTILIDVLLRKLKAKAQCQLRKLVRVPMDFALHASCLSHITAIAHQCVGQITSAPFGTLLTLILLRQLQYRPLRAQKYLAEIIHRPASSSILTLSFLSVVTAISVSYVRPTWNFLSRMGPSHRKLSDPWQWIAMEVTKTNVDQRYIFDWLSRLLRSKSMEGVSSHVRLSVQIILALTVMSHLGRSRCDQSSTRCPRRDFATLLQLQPSWPRRPDP
jgi:hypothetical protein